MKTLLTSFLILISVSYILAQVPQGINYQGVARNGTGSPLSNKVVYINISILKDSPSGVSEYKETHKVTTNAQGLFNLSIGSGVAVTGQFQAINWAVGKKFTKIEMSTDNVNFLLMGTQQLGAVPYALYSGLPWVTTGSNIYYNKGNLAIGHTAPVNSLLHLNSSNTTSQYAQLRITGFAPRIDLDFAGKTRWRLISLSNANFALENQTTFGQPLTVTPVGNIGIGTPTPTATKLHVHSDNLHEPQVRLTGYSPRIDLDFPGNNNWRMVSATNGNFAIQHWPYSSPFWINPEGNVGIGIELPRAKVHVESGDIYLADPTKGVIQTSPDGSCWRMTVSNAGAPVFTKIPCP